MICALDRTESPTCETNRSFKHMDIGTSGMREADSDDDPTPTT